MLNPKDILGQLPGGRVLDLATGSGGFIHFLLEGLPGYTEIIGLDNNERAAAAFTAAFKDRPNIHFELGDALHLGFDSATFDLVCLSNSLHHFNDPLPVLRQMERVLRPGGHLLISEMYRDGQTETQLTPVHLHHWWAAVDTVTGIVHRETYQRRELLEMVAGLGLENLAVNDLSDLEQDPKNPEIMAELEPVFERYIQRAEGHPELQARGAELRQRVQEIGFHSATTLLALGRKAERG
jgi:ubiquinone/menaquinone biosynthesis C-methylase UbiE